MDRADREFEALLKRCSRSFYLTLRLLPAELRPVLSLAYLLARISDNVADVSRAPVEQRRAVLLLMQQVMQGRADADDLDELGRRLAAPALAQTPTEYVLLRRYGDWLLRLEQLPAEQGALVRRVQTTILQGQIEDLEAPSFTEEAQTLRYCDMVAGCVGAFWTELGYAAMPERFADPAMRELMAQEGLRYGRGLQLINILRDEAEDAERGRRYLAGPSREVWCDRAERYLRDGIDYAGRLRSFRLRLATMLPARLGLRTLELLRRRKGTERVKISRRAVYAELLTTALRALVRRLP